MTSSSDATCVNCALTNVALGQFPVALFALEEKLQVVSVGDTLHVLL